LVEAGADNGAGCCANVAVLASSVSAAAESIFFIGLSFTLVVVTRMAFAARCV
jgi:hypothetical protein